MKLNDARLFRGWGVFPQNFFKNNDGQKGSKTNLVFMM
jgi:hypothetical protein